MWVIDIHLDEHGAYRWRLWSRDGRPAGASPQGYAARANAQRLARRFHEEARDLHFEVTAEDIGRFRWEAADAEGTPLARSAPVFATPEDAAQHAESVRRYAGGARVP